MISRFQKYNQMIRINIHFTLTLSLSILLNLKVLLNLQNYIKIRGKDLLQPTRKRARTIRCCGGVGCSSTSSVSDAWAAEVSRCKYHGQWEEKLLVDSRCSQRSVVYPVTSQCTHHHWQSVRKDCPESKILFLVDNTLLSKCIATKDYLSVWPTHSVDFYYLFIV